MIRNQLYPYIEQYINEYLYNYVFHNGSLSLVRPFNLDDSLVCLDNVYYKINR